MTRQVFYTNLFVLAILSTGLLHAQTPCAAPSAIAELNANNIRATIKAGGNLFNDGSEGRFQYVDPATGAVSPTTIYTSSMWLGGLDPALNLRLAANEYGSGYWPGPLNDNGTTNVDDCFKWDKIFFVNGNDIASMLAQLPGLSAAELVAQYPSIAGWPGQNNPFFADINGFDLPVIARPFAPFYDENDDGVYNPLDGDYPAVFLQDKPSFVPAQMAWTVFNLMGAGTPEINTSIPMETQLLAWVFDCNDQPVLNNTVFTNHKTFYLSGEKLDSVAFALFADFDLGCYLDDYQGCNPALNTMFAYNTDVVDGNPASSCLGTPVFQGNIPVQSATLLNKSLDKFMYYESGGVGSNPPATNDPNQIFEYYNFLNAHWRDGSPLTYGGTGYNLNNLPPVDHAFPDDPASVTGWTMCIAGITIGDRRTLAIHNPGTLLPGAVNEFTTAWTYHPDSDLPCGLGNTFDDIALVQAFFDTAFDGVCSPLVSNVEPSLKGRIVLSPNPATDAVTVQYGDVAVQHIHLFDPSGRLVRSYHNVPSGNMTLSLSGLPSGLYNMQFLTTSGSWVEKLVVR